MNTDHNDLNNALTEPTPAHVGWTSDAFNAFESIYHFNNLMLALMALELITSSQLVMLNIEFRSNLFRTMRNYRSDHVGVLISNNHDLEHDIHLNHHRPKS